MALSAEDARLHAELYANLIAYWREVDLNGGRDAASYFTETGIFDGGTHKQAGRAAIAEFYAWRQGRGPRLSRHVVTNFHVERQGPDRAVTNWIMLLYAADGEPVLPSEPAIAISDVTDVCVLCEDGEWRYALRTFSALFKSDTPTTVPAAGALERK